MKIYVIFILTILATGGIVYGLSGETLEEKLEGENQEILETYAREQATCYTTATGTSHEILKKHDACKLRPKPKLKEISTDGNTGSGEVTNAKATTGSVIPVPGYTSKHKINLTGSHDYRKYSTRKGAGWKNNNPSGLTYGVSNVLKNLWKEAGITYNKGTYRPKNEGGNYVLFESVEDGLRAKIIAIRERWGKATVSHFLGGWGTDYIKLSFSNDKKIQDLSEEEFAELFIQQIKKETPGYISQLVEDKILIIN